MTLCGIELGRLLRYPFSLPQPRVLGTIPMLSCHWIDIDSMHSRGRIGDPDKVETRSLYTMNPTIANDQSFLRMVSTQLPVSQL